MKRIVSFALFLTLFLLPIVASAATIPEQIRTKYLSDYSLDPTETLEAALAEMQETIQVALQVQEEYTKEIAARKASIEEAETKVCTLTVHINFVPNLMFSTYDVVMNMNGIKKATLPHGKSQDFEFIVEPGTYTFMFHEDGLEHIKGSTTVEVAADMQITVRISCSSDRVEVSKTAAKLTTNGLKGIIEEKGIIEATRIVAELDTASTTHYFMDAYFLDDIFAIDFDMGSRYSSTKSTVRKSIAGISLRLFKALFDASDAKEIRIAFYADLRNVNTGKMSNLQVANIRFSRESFSEIDYDWMTERIKNYPDNFIDGADFHSMHEVFRN